VTYHDPLTPAQRAWADEVRQAAHRAWDTGGLGAYQEDYAPLVALIRSLNLHGKGQVSKPLGDPRLCACGCGEAVPVARRTDRRSGAAAGQAGRYVHGHNPRKQLVAAERSAQ
jgi:hypothetical protein